MNNLLKYFSLAPVLLTFWVLITSIFLIIINHFYR